MEYKTKICKWCNRPFQAEVKQMFANGKPNGKKCRIDYCSKECKSNGLAKAAKKADHSKQREIPNFNCLVCGKPIYRAPRHIKKNSRTCCSRSCYAKIKRTEMMGNKYGEGHKQTPERIAHRVSFIIGEKNACWNGGITYRKGRNNNRYKYVKCPREFKDMANKQGYVAEHRLIMARLINRPLTRKEVVHHINHNTLDNRPENLQLFSNNAEHKLFEGKTGYFKEYWKIIRHNCTSLRNSDKPIHPLHLPIP